MQTKTRIRAAAVLTVAPLLVFGGIAGADQLEADEVTSVGINGSMNFGDVCVGDSPTKTLNLAMRRIGGPGETLVNGSTVTIKNTAASAGLTAGAPSGTITVPGNWQSAAPGTLSPAVTAPVTLNAASVGAYSGSVTYQSDGQRVGGNGVFSDTDTIPVTANVITCAVPDTTAPELSVPANITAEATSAAGAAVSYSASAVDDVDGSVPIDCSPASGSTFALGATTVNCSATDAAGNEATGSFTVTVVDTTAPTLSGVPGNQNVVATGSNGAVVSYATPTAADAVDPNPAVDCLPVSGSTFALGTHTVSCTATDASGNASAPQTFTVSVQYASSGILQPINADGSSKFKLNSTIPVKIKLSGASAGIDDAVITQSVSKLTNDVWGDELEGTSTATPHSGNALRYDAASDQYVFNLSTKSLSTGTFRVTLNLGGGKTETAKFSIVK